MDYVAKETPLRHVDRHKMKIHVGIVLEHHEMFLHFLGGLYELPTVLHLPGRLHFTADVLAVFQGKD